MKILALHNGTGSRYYRLIPMLKEAQARGHEVILEPHDTDHVDQKIEWCDLVIFQMVFSEELVKLAKGMGKKVVFECDDLIHRVPEDHYSYKETAGFKKQLKWWWLMWGVFRRCDAFISTNPRLNRIYGWMAKRRFVFKNYCDLPHWMKEPKKNPTDRIRILWAGSTSHTPDLKWIKPVMDRILRRHKNVQFIYIGHGGIKSTDMQAKFVYGEDIFEGLPDNRESMLSAPAGVWPYTLSTLMADIAIAPLEKNYFNTFKSQCKYLEYSINKIPAVYAKWHYTDVRDGITGLLADTPEEWEAAIESLIENRDFRLFIGDDCFRDVVENHDMRLHVDRWLAFIESV